MLNAYSNHGDIETCLKIINEELKLHGHSPDAYIENNLIRVYFINEQYEIA